MLQVLLEDGMAYVSWVVVIDAMVEQFKIQLFRRLDKLKARLHVFESAERHRLDFVAQRLRAYVLFKCCRVRSRSLSLLKADLFTCSMHHETNALGNARRTLRSSGNRSCQLCMRQHFKTVRCSSCASKDTASRESRKTVARAGVWCTMATGTKLPTTNRTERVRLQDEFTKATRCTTR